jgi:competence protein ComEC
MPAIGLIVMPMALLTVVLMPFGLEALPLALMGWGLDWMNAVAAKTAEWSAGYGSVPMVSAASLLLAVAAFLWLILWRERWRFAGLLPLALALPLAAATPHPDIIVNAAGTAAAARASDGKLRILGADDFTVENWLRADGDVRGVDDVTLRTGVSCDRLGCVTVVDGVGQLALALRPEAFAEDCRRSMLVLSGFDAPAACATRATVIDGRALRSGGAHALYRDGDGYRVETAYPAVRRPFMPATSAR